MKLLMRAKRSVSTVWVSMARVWLGRSQRFWSMRPEAKEMRLGVWDWMSVVVFDSASCRWGWLHDACSFWWMSRNLGCCFLLAPKALHRRDHVTGMESMTSLGCSRTALDSERLITMFHFELKILKEKIPWLDNCWLMWHQRSCCRSPAQERTWFAV